MTNKERYKQAFSAIHVSEEFSLKKGISMKDKSFIPTFCAFSSTRTDEMLSADNNGTKLKKGMEISMKDKSFIPDVLCLSSTGTDEMLSADNNGTKLKKGMDIIIMKKTDTKHRLNTLVASIAACLLIVVSSTVAYSADLGGIQRKVQLWIQGNQTEVTIDFNSGGSYNMEYLDSNGNAVHKGGGGVALNPDGSERPLTEEELMDNLDQPEVEYKDDGSVWVYYLNQKIDITDKFDDNVCYVQLSNGKKVLYMTVRYQNGYGTSPHKYPSPS